MIRNKFSIVVYAIIGLALIGIISQLYTNPVAFLKNIFMIIGIGIVLFSIVYFIFLRNRSYQQTNEMKKYKQAVKQSQLKYKSNHYKQSPLKKQRGPQRMKKRSNQRPSHLRVIEGNRDKTKGKNRATF